MAARDWRCWHCRARLGRIVTCGLAPNYRNADIMRQLPNGCIVIRCRKCGMERPFRGAVLPPTAKLLTML